MPRKRSRGNDDSKLGYESAWVALIGAVLLLVLLAVTMPAALGLLRHWNAYLPENSLPVLLVSGAVALLLSLALLVVVLRHLELTDKRFALGLPDGSIRAVIALLLILLFFISSVFLYSNGRQAVRATVLDPVSRATVDAIPPATLVSVEPSAVKGMFRVLVRPDTTASDDLAKQLLTTLSTLVVAVAAFYFGANSVASATHRATAATTGQTGEELATKLRSLFAGDAFSGMKVSVAGSTAVFAGTVADEALREEAERQARALPGIDNVRMDSLTVSPVEKTEEPTTAPDKPLSESSANKTMDETSGETGETSPADEEVVAADTSDGTETAETPDTSGAETEADETSEEDDQSAPA